MEKYINFFTEYKRNYIVINENSHDINIGLIVIEHLISSCIKYIHKNDINKLDEITDVEFYDDNIKLSTLYYKISKELITGIKSLDGVSTSFKWRINQLEAIKRLEENGLETGIHCQATGCGKTYIILKYCDYFYKKSIKGNIIIFTERINILKDLFGFENNLVNFDNKIFWKSNNICDLDNFQIHNRITIKKNDWVKLLSIPTDKPNILIINRAYLTSNKNYQSVPSENIGMILHDECHNTTSDSCYDFLSWSKLMGIPIIGFSATPLRFSSDHNYTEKNREKLIDIYGKDSNNTILKNNVNLLTNYNMIHSIINNLILEPKFYWFPILIDNYNFENKNLITIEHIYSIMTLMNKVIIELPYKKIIAWCGTIELAEKWYNIFNKNLKKIPKLSGLSLFLDHSKIKSNDIVMTGYDEFKKLENSAILFCADKHKEGSDIMNLDCCIFLDRCQSKSPIPFIQSIGRVLRKNNLDKKYGLILDGYIIDNKSYKDKTLFNNIICSKASTYLFALMNCNNIDDSDYCNIKNNISLNDNNIVIKLNEDKQINILF